MNGRRHPLRGMAPDELDQVPRREAFKQEHPGSDIYPVGGMQQAHIPYGSGGITVTRATLKELLGVLDEMFTEPPDSG